MDYYYDTSKASMDRAQRTYDAMMPPEYDECEGEEREELTLCFRCNGHARLFEREEMHVACDCNARATDSYRHESQAIDAWNEMQSELAADAVWLASNAMNAS